MKTTSYKDFIGSVKFDRESGEYYGRIINIEDYVDYIAAHDETELEKIFHEAVDDYLADLGDEKPKMKSNSSILE